MTTQRFDRTNGVLMHPTALPGGHGIGDLGDTAFRFVDLLSEAGAGIWQILPLGPVGGGNSPYDARSAFAGNPMLISLDRLVEDGLLRSSDLDRSPRFASTSVEFGRVSRWKNVRLARAFEIFASSAQDNRHAEFEAFKQRESGWVADYALYQALRDHHGDSWLTWEAGLISRHTDSIAKWTKRLHREIEFHQFVQFLFDQQWRRLKAYANERGIRIMGDIPIYIALDSADVWANQEQFLLDEQGNPTVIAGVPPDLFSSTGQLWGNPCYDWSAMARDNYRWWTARFARVFKMTDLVRIDHFRGFAAGWQVPADRENAIQGEWVPGPGEKLFHTVENALGDLPVVVEDLGIITEDVVELRERLGYPGMNVLQFGFGGDADNPYLPHNYVPNSVVYTGTHDNETTAGWFASQDQKTQRHVIDYLGRSTDPVQWGMIRSAWGSVAEIAIAPVQDLLGLDNSARFNSPGKARGNWKWRLERLSDLKEHVPTLRTFNELYGRANPLTMHSTER